MTSTPRRPQQQQYEHYHPEIQQPDISALTSINMERVLFQLHLRSCHTGLRYLSGSTRRILEHLLLIAAICIAGILILLHRNFVWKTGATNCASTCLTQIPGFSDQAAVYHITILPTTQQIPETIQSFIASSQDERDDSTCQEATLPISYSFSTTKAYLLLPSGHFLLENLQQQHLHISPQDPNCFGEPFLQFWIHNAGIGSYETIAWNWLVELVHLQQQQEQPPHDEVVGYVLTHRTGRIRELKAATTTSTRQAATNESTTMAAPPQRVVRRRPQDVLDKLSVLIKTTFLFFFSTTLISFTLRETQERMLEFTQELSRRVSIQLPLVDLVIFHLIHNLVFVPIMVGMMFFLIEFYSGDKLLAFLVMTIVWCVEVFSVISLRSYQGITFFPRMFFLLFCLFHIYYFANPYGFAYLALAVVATFMWHSMAFFWHRYELPAVALGHVTIDRPRGLYYNNNSNNNNNDSHQHQQRQRQDESIVTASPPRMVSGNSETSLTGNNNNIHRGTDTTSTTTQSSRSTTATTSSIEVSSLQPPSPPRIRSFNQQDDRDHDPLDFDPVSQPANNNRTSTNTATARVAGSVAAMTTRAQNASFSSTTSSRNSGSASGGGIIFREHNADEDEDSSSYMYFMQGEVVLHRRTTAAGSNNSGGTQPQQPPPILSTVESNHTLASTTSGQDAQQPPQQRSTAAVDVGLELGDDEDDVNNQNDNKRPFTIEYASPEREATANATTSETALDYAAEDSKSGLQAILEVRLTPRHRNPASTTTVPAGGRPSDQYTRSQQQQQRSCPPIFPNLPP